jgi:hypothetical protein
MLRRPEWTKPQTQLQRWSLQRAQRQRLLRLSM